MAVASLPLVIQNSIRFVAAYLLTPTITFGRSGDRQRAMRSDRRRNIEAVLGVLLRACSLQHDGICCHFTRFWVRAISIPEIASYLNICTRTVARCLADLVDLGLIECKQIKRKNPATGQFEVSIGLRRFTDKFWEAIGQLEQYRQSCAWAKKHGRRKFLCPFKSINLKIKSTVRQVSEAIGSLIKNVSGSGGLEAIDSKAEKIKYNCNKILTLLRQKK